MMGWFVWLGLPLGFVQSTLWNGILTSATALLLWLTAVRLGYSNNIGAILGLLFGLCTHLLGPMPITSLASH